MFCQLPKILFFFTMLASFSCVNKVAPLSESKLDAAENAARMIALTELSLDESEASRIRGIASSRSYVNPIVDDARYRFQWNLPTGMKAIVVMSETEEGVQIGTATARKVASDR